MSDYKRATPVDEYIHHTRTENETDLLREKMFHPPHILTADWQIIPIDPGDTKLKSKLYRRADVRAAFIRSRTVLLRINFRVFQFRPETKRLNLLKRSLPPQTP